MMMERQNDQGFLYAYNLLREEPREEELLFKLVQEVSVRKAAIGMVSQAKKIKEQLKKIC
jgi:hypothetical protein